MSAPGSSTLADATPIAVGDVSVTPTAGLSHSEVPGDYGPDYPETAEMTAWWKWTADRSQLVTISTAGSTAGMDTQVWVYRSTVDSPTVNDLTKWWYVDQEGPGDLAELHTVYAFEGETYWIRCGLFSPTDGQYQLSVTAADAELAPVRPTVTGLDNPRANPADPELYLGHIVSTNAYYSNITSAVWVGRRSADDRDSLVELGRFNVPASSSRYGGDQVVGLQWLDDTHFMCLAIYAAYPDPYDARILVGTVVDDVVTFGTPQPIGATYLSQVPLVEGATAKFFRADSGMLGNAVNPGILSFEFGTGTAANITTSAVGFDVPSNMELQHSQLLAGGDVLVHTQQYVYLQRADGSTGPQCPINRRYDDPARPSFQTMDICSGYSSWTDHDQQDILGYAHGTDFWAAGVIYTDTTSEACFVHYDLNTGARDVWPMGMMGATWDTWAIYSGQSGKLSDSSFFVSFMAPADDGDAWIEHYSWLLIDMATRTMIAKKVTGDKVDLARMSGVPAGPVDSPVGLVTGGLRTAGYSSITGTQGALFYPANGTEEPVIVSALKATRCRFA